MKHELVLYPAPVLKTVCEEVKLPLSKEDKDLLDEMYNYIKDPENHALGLAAPQFGVTKRMIVIRLIYTDYKLCLKLVNPRIIIQDKTPYFVKDGESCLSEPDLTVNVPRAKAILLMGYDVISNKQITLRLDKFPAAVVQHEVDHLNGILLHDYIEGEK